jgi:glycylpeptide N-tetradecanoyltransferase
LRFLVRKIKITNAKYYHRPINIKKLLDINFIAKPGNITYKTYERLYKLNDRLKLNIRKIQEKDIETCCNKLNDFNKKYKVHQRFTLDEFRHKFYYSDNIVDSYVIETDNKITDFVSIIYCVKYLLEIKILTLQKRI